MHDANCTARISTGDWPCHTPRNAPGQASGGAHERGLREAAFQIHCFQVIKKFGSLNYELKKLLFTFAVSLARTKIYNRDIIGKTKGNN